jgi:hypothetical protein
MYTSIVFPVLNYHHTMKSSITMAARSKAWIVFVRSNAGNMCLNPAQGMDVCVRLFCVYV